MVQADLKHSWSQKKEASRSICLHTGHCMVDFFPQLGVQHLAEIYIVEIIFCYNETGFNL
jgi:hypothetical protein